MLHENSAASDCPPEKAFVDLTDGRLSGGAAARLRGHIERCAACRDLLDGLMESSSEGASVHVSHTTTDSKIAEAVLRDDAVEGSVGRTISRKYVLRRLLGKGGMGAVYEAEHTGTGRSVALKLIHDRLLDGRHEAERRFRREARAASALDCPHVVQILDSGEDEATGTLYIAMELLRGEDLHHLIEREGPLRPDVALRIAAQALVGLAKAHGAGIVHRDIKPANIFLARRDEGEVLVKLLDFGIAKITADPLNVAQTTGLTEQGGALGSPLYMSPEQMQSSKDVDHRTDLWSLGSVLYCALAGRAPFRHVANVFELAVAIRSASGRPSVGELAPWVSPGLAVIVHRALAVDPDERYPTASAMLDALRQIVVDGFALREEMLVGIPEDERAVIAAENPRPIAEHAVDPNAPDSAMTGQKASRAGHMWARRTAVAAFVTGFGALGVYELVLSPAPPPITAASAPEGQPSLTTPPAPAPSATPADGPALPDVEIALSAPPQPTSSASAVTAAAAKLRPPPTASSAPPVAGSTSAAPADPPAGPRPIDEPRRK